MRTNTISALVVVCCAGVVFAQRGAGGPRARGGGGGGGEGGIGNLLMNDPFAFRRFFHPLANQRFMSSMGFNMYEPNIATLGLLFDMELPDALLYSALSGGRPMRGRGRRPHQQPQQNPFLVALGLVDGADGPDPRPGGRAGGRKRGGRRGGPPKAQRKGRRQRAGRTEAGPGGASEARG